MAAAAVIAVVAIGSFGSPAGAAAASLICTVLVGAWNLSLRRKLTIMRARVGAMHASDTTSSTLEESVEQVEEQLASLRHQLLSSHPVSGLPMREALLARMAANQSGYLGVLAFADSNRLTAIDPALAERLFAATAARLRSMLAKTRLAAQLDCSHIGLWFADENEIEARAELEAITYALGEEIEDDGYNFTPQIKVRLERFDAQANVDARTMVARAVASFSLPSDVTLTTVQDHPRMDHAALARDRYAIEQDLQLAIARHEFRLHFQPLIDANFQRVDGAEALIRWTHAERGPISPSRFIPIMESIGLASEIGLWALNAAAREAKIWRSKGLPRMRIAVNVSGLQLERDDLPVLIQRTLQHHQLSADALELELTESVATTDADHCRRIFEKLRAMGVRLAVDDFGTGYSGFSSLRRLAFDKIKIDREFVTDVDSRRDSQAICNSIIALGRGLGIKVLAEGIERHEEYQWLRRQGCHHFQGYYFACPMESDAFQAFVRDTKTLQVLLRIDDAVAPIIERKRA